MDVRNIKVNKLELLPTEYLHKVYQLGEEQLKGYIKIEGLPSYPLDINPRSSQVVLKDFIGRVVEELTEGYESTSEVVSIMAKAGWNLDLVEDYKDLLNHLQNANEEQADAIGFYTTLLLYSNILPEDVYDYASTHLEKKIDTLNDLMSYGVKLLYEQDENYISRTGYSLFNENLSEYYGVDYHKVNSYTPGFHSMSEQVHEAEAFHLWQVTYNINLARNLLKNRPWKQTQVMSKELEYQESVVKSFLMYLGFLAVNGFTQETLFELFYRKQQLNIWRQNTGY